MILNPNNIGINVFNIADEIIPKYYYLETLNDSKSLDDLNSFSISLTSVDVNLTNSVTGTIKEIEERLKFFVWEHIKNFENVRNPFTEIVLPTETLMSESVNKFHRKMITIHHAIKNKVAMMGLGLINITNISLHSHAKNFIYYTWDFNIEEKLNIGVTINDNLPLNKMIFTNISNDTIAHSNTCLVYRNIDNYNQTFTTYFDIITKNSDIVISVNLPSKVFRKNKIDELL